MLAGRLGQRSGMEGSHDADRHTNGRDAEVQTLMTRAVARISPDATLQELATKLAAVEVGALTVGTPGEVTGIVSERDLVRAFAWSSDPDAVARR